MPISTNINRIKAAKESLRLAINSKGRNLDATAKIEDYAAEVTAIEASGGSTAILNIAYSDTAPADTTKLWCRCAEPNKVFIRAENSTVDAMTALYANPTEAVAGAAIARIGDYVYFFGGLDASNAYLASIRKLSLLTGELTTLSTVFPAALKGARAVVYNGNIFVIGGYSNTAGVIMAIRKFNPIDETLVDVGNIGSYGGSTIGCGLVGSRLYVFGGKSISSKYTGAVRHVDLDTFAINTLTASTEPNVFSNCVVSYGTKIYIFGGAYSEQYNMANGYNTIQVLDTDTQLLSTLSCTLPYSGSRFYAVGFGNNMYVFGGCTTNGASTNRVYKFDAIAETVVTMPALTRSVCNLNGFEYQGRLYFSNGYVDYSEGSYRLFTDVFNFAPELEADCLLISNTQYKNLFNIINSADFQVKQGITAVYRGDVNGLAQPVEAYLYNTIASEWQLIS